jgi:hypothetical protein
MDIYHIWCDLKPGTSDTTFSDNIARYLGHLRDEGLIESWRCTRAKLGFGARGLGEWHVMIETRDMHQLEDAFQRVAGRHGAVEGFHHGVNSLATNVSFALYRDFPDAVRVRGEEKF